MLKMHPDTKLKEAEPFDLVVHWEGVPVILRCITTSVAGKQRLDLARSVGPVPWTLAVEVAAAFDGERWRMTVQIRQFCEDLRAALEDRMDAAVGTIRPDKLDVEGDRND